MPLKSRGKNWIRLNVKFKVNKMSYLLHLNCCKPDAIYDAINIVIKTEKGSKNGEN